MKKVLSFVLVLAMILGSVSMAFAFTDDASITNVEAAKVLSAAGVLEGYTDGSFKADGILTRAEGAAIAARMLLGKSDAAKLSTVVNPFNDVNASDWCAGYIAYCVSQGIIAGYGNGNFGPNDTLSVAAFGKMMLTALGYKADQEGFLGEAWESNVGSMMVKAGLTDGVTTTNNAGCSRGTAAQVALNTLKANLVEYPNGGTTTVSAGNATVVIGAGQAKKQEWSWVGAGNDGNYKTADGYKQFMEEYQKDLKLGATAGDAFGRPDTNKWTFKGESVYTAKSSSNRIASYTTKQNKKTIYSLLDGVDARKNTTTLDVWEDGVQTTTTAAVKATTATWKNDTANAYGGNGTQIEVYYDSTKATDGAVTVVMYNYYLVKASADYNASKGTVKIGWESVTKPTGAPNEIDKKDFAAVADVHDGDYLVVTVANGEIKSMAPATKVTGTVTGYTVSKDVTVDGTKYTVGAKAKANTADSLSTNTELTLVLDPNNFVLETTEEVASKQFVYIRAFQAKSALEPDGKKEAAAYFIDGTTKTIDIDKNSTVVANAWHNYSVKSTGEYKLSAVSGTYSEDHAAGIDIIANKTTYTSGAGITTPGAASADTVFIVRNNNNNKVNVYTGYKNVPGTTGATMAAVVKSGFAKYVYFETTNALTNASTDEYLVVYKTGTADSLVSGDDTYYTYGKTFVNGVQKTAEFDSKNFAGQDITTTNLTTGIYVGLSYADGKISGGSKLVGEAGYDDLGNVTTASTVEYSNGTLQLGAAPLKIDASAVAYVIDGDTVDEVSFSSLKNARDDNATYRAWVVYTNTTDEIVKALYLINTAY